ncbi:hypothetical protein RRG08_031167 [Elysia crispata]|uniref:Uncharacterized protein n=1 Tax=Elysia crispata TaxID=231223 RepID=A0AAE0ZFD9_9GAST|nr:hypothetical protein RRG08_031167 [Elysia crispata]
MAVAAVEKILCGIGGHGVCFHFDLSPPLHPSSSANVNQSLLDSTLIGRPANPHANQVTYHHPQGSRG